MDPTVIAAVIAGGFGILTLAGTLVAQYLGYRATSKDAEKIAEEQRKQLDRTLAEQRMPYKNTASVADFFDAYQTASDEDGG